MVFRTDVVVVVVDAVTESVVKPTPDVIELNEVVIVVAVVLATFADDDTLDVAEVVLVVDVDVAVAELL